jgi:hypothetical protein
MHSNAIAKPPFKPRWQRILLWSVFFLLVIGALRFCQRPTTEKNSQPDNVDTILKPNEGVGV